MMRRAHLLPFTLLAGSTALVFACSGDSSGTDGGADAGSDVTTQDTGTQDTSTGDAGMDVVTTQDSGGQDTGSDAPMVVNGCTSFTNDTTTTAVITGPSGGSPSQYSPNCVHIKRNQSVTWNSDFSAHPLQASGGTMPSPITTTSSGMTVTFTFNTLGTYGFDCAVHPGIMFGAVEVTP